LFTIWTFLLVPPRNNLSLNQLFQTIIKRRGPILLQVNQRMEIQRKRLVLRKRALQKRVPQKKVALKKQRPKVHLQVQRGLLQDQPPQGHLPVGQHPRKRLLGRHHRKQHLDLQPNLLHQDHPHLVHLNDLVIHRSLLVQHNHKDLLHVLFTQHKGLHLTPSRLNRLYIRTQHHRRLNQYIKINREQMDLKNLSNQKPQQV
jgi:hypothetical protein